MSSMGIVSGRIPVYLQCGVDTDPTCPVQKCE